MLKSEDAYFDGSAGTPCPGTPEELALAVNGQRATEAAKRSDAAYNLGATRKEVSYQLSMLSGACPVGGQLSGPVEFVSFRVGEGVNDKTVAVSSNKARQSAVYLNGEPVGKIVRSRIDHNKFYRQLASGERVEMKQKNEEAQRLSEQRTYSVTFTTLGPDGHLVAPEVGFTFFDLTPEVRVTLTRQVDANRQIMESFGDGKLGMRMHLKDGIAHGWYEIYNPAIPGGISRTCFQNAQIIMAEQCPDN